jgi:hypothetical protein
MKTFCPIEYYAKKVLYAILFSIMQKKVSKKEERTLKTKVLRK